MTVPAILTHAQRLYDEMLAESKPHDEGGHLYKGYMQETFKRTNLSSPYYSRITNLLKEMGCITQIQRGARGGKESVWHLRQRPTEELMLEVDPAAINGSNQLAELVRQNHSILNQKIRDLGRRLSSLEEEVKRQGQGSQLGVVTVPPPKTPGKPKPLKLPQKEG
jgi:hypothetical protein